MLNCTVCMQSYIPDWGRPCPVNRCDYSEGKLYRNVRDGVRETCTLKVKEENMDKMKLEYLRMHS